MVRGPKELIKIGQWLRKSKYASQITSLHLLGVSLGGHASLYASVYNDHLPKPIYKSILSYCPVINLETTSKHLFNNGLIGIFFTQKTKRYMTSILNSLKDKSNLSLLQNEQEENVWTKILDESALTHLLKINPNTFLSPFKGQKIKNLNEFWKLNNFLETLKKVQVRPKTPTLIFYSKNDYLITAEQQVEKFTSHIKSSANNQLSNFSFVPVENAGHCLFTGGYGWPTFSSITKSIFIKNSPELLSKRVKKVARINFQLPRVRKSLGASKRIVQKYNWLAKANKNYISLRFSPSAPCKNKERTSFGCSNLPYVRIPFSQLPFGHYISVPEDEDEAKALTRWVNGNIFFKDSNKKNLKNFLKSKFLTWYEY